MRFEIAHRIAYAYSREVFVEPKVVRLRPRSDPWQTLHAHELDVDPAPAGVAEGIDAWGNPCAWLWFEGTQDRLELTARSEVETHRTDPFDFVLPSPSLDRLPAPYASDDAPALAPFLGPAPEGAVAAFAKAAAADADGHLIPFLGRLASRIYETHEAIIRPEGSAWSSERTLAEATGSCRDLTVLYVEACRSVGVAARFVSGYQQGDPDTDERELHAWAEAYVPGGGWRPYDPTHGLAVTDGHVALAGAADPAGAAPTAGSYRGTGVSSRMEAAIEMRVR